MIFHVLTVICASCLAKFGLFPILKKVAICQSSLQNLYSSPISDMFCKYFMPVIPVPIIFLHYYLYFSVFVVRIQNFVYLNKHCNTQLFPQTLLPSFGQMFCFSSFHNPSPFPFFFLSCQKLYYTLSRVKIIIFLFLLTKQGPQNTEILFICLLFYILMSFSLSNPVRQVLSLQHQLDSNLLSSFISFAGSRIIDRYYYHIPITYIFFPFHTLPVFFLTVFFKIYLVKSFEKFIFNLCTLVQVSVTVSEFVEARG